MQHFGKSIVETRHSVYHVDWDNHLVSGGRLTGTVPFTTGFCMEGEHMVLCMEDTTLVTSTVTKVTQERSENYARKQQKGLSRLFCFRRA